MIGLHLTLQIHWTASFFFSSLPLTEAHVRYNLVEVPVRYDLVDLSWHDMN